MDENNIIRQEIIAQEKTAENILPEMYAPKPLFELTKRDTTFAFITIIVSIFTALFGIFGGFSFGYSLTIVFMIALFSIYFVKNTTVKLPSLIYGVLALALSSVFVCTTNGSVRFFGLVISFLLSLVFFDAVINKAACGNRETLNIFYSASSTASNTGVAMKSLLTSGDGGKKTVGKVMLGLLCAAPVLIVVVPLLIKSDDAFSGMMHSIFSGSGNAFLTILKVIFGLIISIFVISYGFSLKYNRISKLKESKFKGIENVYVISFLSAIATCYMLYLFSQLAYFFSAFKGFLPDGDITYAQYARKGFFEMCVIAVINLGIIFLSILIAKKQDGKVCHSIRVIATFIASFTLIIITTAISKMVLYINTYGMTILRVTTSAFMLFLAVVFMASILRIHITKINIVKTSLIAAGCIVLILGTVNVNAVCARYNYQAYKTKKLNTIDIEAIYELGDEGIPYLTRLVGAKDKNVANDAQYYLAKAYMEDYFYNMHYTQSFDAKALKERQKCKGFSYFSIPKNQAYSTLYKFIDKNPQFSLYCLNQYKEKYDVEW